MGAVLNSRQSWARSSRPAYLKQTTNKQTNRGHLLSTTVRPGLDSEILPSLLPWGKNVSLYGQACGNSPRATSGLILSLPSAYWDHSHTGQVHTGGFSVDLSFPVSLGRCQVRKGRSHKGSVALDHWHPEALLGRLAEAQVVA